MHKNVEYPIIFKAYFDTFQGDFWEEFWNYLLSVHRVRSLNYQTAQLGRNIVSLGFFSFQIMFQFNLSRINIVVKNFRKVTQKTYSFNIRDMLPI